LIIVAVALVVVVAVVVWLFLRGGPDTTGSPSSQTPVPTSTRTTPPPTVAPPQWHDPVKVGEYLTDTKLYLDGIAVFADESTTPETYIGFDLATRQVVWQHKIDAMQVTSADETGIVFQDFSADQMIFVDPKTGKMTKMTNDYRNSFLWAGYGFVLTDQYKSSPNDLCVSKMTDPTKCVWRDHALNLPLDMRNNLIFGDGQWVNTATGVKQLATGQPASFGQDVTDSLQVYYTGTSADRVFRVQYESGHNATRTYQPWDITADKAVSPAVQATFVITSPTSSTYVAIVTTSGDVVSNGVSTNYDWATGQRMWQLGSYTGVWHPRFFGNNYVQLDLMTWDSGIPEAVDPQGQLVWRGGWAYETSFDYIADCSDSTCYVLNVRSIPMTVTAFNTDWQPIWVADAPLPRATSFNSISFQPGYVVISDVNGEVWVMDV